MGNNGTKVIEVGNISAVLAQCEEIDRKNCKVYGPIHLVRYNNSEFYIKETQSVIHPKPFELHYLVPPRFLVIPKFTLLEEATPSSLEDLLELVKGVGELCGQQSVGVRHRRIGYAGKWGAVGESVADWGYKQVLLGKNSQGIFLSPQQMIGISDKRQTPKHNPQKSDMFSLGIMLIELIFKESMDQIFDYRNYEIKLKPLLSRLNIIKQEFGNPFYELMLKMLEFEEESRLSFSGLLQEVQQLEGETKVHKSHVRSTSRSPIRRRQLGERNQNLPSQSTRWGDRTRIEGGLRSPEQRRINMSSRAKSPIKRDLRINSCLERQDKQNNTSSNTFIPKSPFKLQPSQPQKRGLSPLIRRI